MKKCICSVLISAILISLFCFHSYAATTGDILRAPEAGWARYDDTNPKFNYVGQWETYTSGINAYNSTLHDSRSNVAENKMTFKFIGTKLRVISCSDPSYAASVNISIDGNIYTYSQNKAANTWIAFEKTGLENTTHNIQIIQTGTGYGQGIVGIDAIDIDDTAQLLNYDANAIPAPARLTATAGNSNVSLSWTPVGQATSYIIKRTTIAGGPYTTIASNITGTTYTDNLVTLGSTNYYYVAIAVNRGDESANSNEAAIVGDVLKSAEAGWARYDDMDVRFRYIGYWNVDNSSIYFNSTLHDTSVLNNENKMTFKFIGTKLRIIGSSDPSYSPTVKISIDGDIYTFSESKSANSWIAFEKTGLENTTHNIQITQVGDTYGCRVGIDAIDIDDTAQLLNYDANAIPAPARLTATAGNSNVSLSWTPVGEATSYIIKRTTTAGGPYTTIASNITGTTYTDASVTLGTTNYYYVAIAVNRGDESANSNEAAIVGDVLKVPEAGWARYDDTNGKFTYAGYWYTDSLSSYYKSTFHFTSPVIPDNKMSFKFIGTNLRIIASSDPSYCPNIKVILDNNTYTFSESKSGYSWIAFEKTGLEKALHTVQIIQTGTGYGNRLGIDAIDLDNSAVLLDYNTTATQAPENLIAIQNNSKVNLSWTAPMGGIASYSVKRSLVAGGPYTTIASNLTSTVYTDTSVTNRTTYYYVVSATNAGMESPNSNETSVFIPSVIKINFQAQGSEIPAGYLPDYGEVYGIRNGYCYGWNTDHANFVRDRNLNADQKLDTLCHFIGGDSWEVQVPNGIYSVTVCVGDPQFASTPTINVGGTNYWDNVSLPINNYLVMTKDIQVQDGKITIDQGNAPTLATRINYIEITEIEVPIATPVKLNAVASLDNIVLTWDSAPGASSYAVEVDGTLIYNVNDTKFTLAQLQSGTTHSFRVKSINSKEESPWSSILSQTTLTGNETRIKINFQPANAGIPDGYIPDAGNAYRLQNGYTYGWNVNYSSATRKRNLNSDERLDTLTLVSSGSRWEFGVPNGIYDVTVCTGDPGFAGSPTINVEGVNYWNNEILPVNQFYIKTMTIHVSDGKITVDNGNGLNNKTVINYIEIVSRN